jgi:probable rRNA maturation factor
MRFTRCGFSFDISLSGYSPLSIGKKRALLRAVKGTISALPPKELRTKLKPNLVYGLSISVVSAPTIRRLNARYRKKNKPTDVLSFSRLEGNPTPSPEIGDVLLCLKVAERQARENGLSLTQELQRLTIHGLLHLFGYDHEIGLREEKRMFRLQNKIYLTLEK